MERLDADSGAPAVELERLTRLLIALGLFERQEARDRGPGVSMDDPVALLRAQARRFPLLDARRERELAYRVQRRDRLAWRLLVCHNIRLALKPAAQRLRITQAFDADTRLTLADYVAVALDALMRAAETFDPNRGTRFSTYATHAIKRELRRFERDAYHYDDRRNTRRSFNDPQLAGSANCATPILAEMTGDPHQPDDEDADGSPPETPSYVVTDFSTSGLGGLDRRHEIVDSEADLRARFSEAQRRGIAQPVLVCRNCGAKTRTRSLETALRWWWAHPCRDLYVEKYTLRPSGDGYIRSTGEQLNFDFQLRRKTERERAYRRAQSAVARLERLREEDRLLYLARHGDAAALHEFAETYGQEPEPGFDHYYENDRDWNRPDPGERRRPAAPRRRCVR